VARAREYLAARKSPALREEREAECARKAADPKDPFCFALEQGKRGRVAAQSSLRRAIRERGRKLKRELLRANLDALESASEAEIGAALREVRELMPILPAMQLASDRGRCRSGALLTALAMKTENFFPAEEYRNLATALYERALECGTGTAQARAAYRLGLLKIWAGKHAEAESAFARIADGADTLGLQPRITYWRLHCAREMKDAKLEESMREKLRRDYPLSLQALLSGVSPVLDPAAELSAGATGATGQEPRVAFRSATRPAFNPAVRAVEAVLEARRLAGDEAGGTEAIGALLDIRLPELREAEPEFQLYVAVLFMRAGDSIRKFTVMTSLVHDHPGWITKHTLEMLYPLRGLEVVQAQGGDQVDPFLVLSLIRQESAFNTRARSRAGAMGLMQLMPRTARSMERVPRNKLYDPDTNVRLGVRYFSRLLEKFGGDPELALAAYNAGGDRVTEWQGRYPVQNRMLFLDLIPFRETREYVAAIARNYYWYLRLYQPDRQPGTFPVFALASATVPPPVLAVAAPAAPAAAVAAPPAAALADRAPAAAGEPAGSPGLPELLNEAGSPQ
jgi:soluble lytic murein transglycosylase